MRYLLLLSVILFAFNTEAQRGRLVLPTTDFSLNAGISLGEIQGASGQSLLGNMNLTSNQPYGRHIFEISASQANEPYTLGQGLLSLDATPTNANVHYTYMHELFSYYPSCQIANQVLLGLKLEADWLFNDFFYNDDGPTSEYYTRDFNHYTASISAGTDYNFNQRNYATFQFYIPIYTSFALGHDTAIDMESSIGDRFEIADYFSTNRQSMFVPDHFKFGAVFTYRMMFSEAVGILLKYHGKLAAKTEYVDEISNLNRTFEQRAHELTLGLIFHRENGMKY